jgi:hypothetical protein
MICFNGARLLHRIFSGNAPSFSGSEIFKHIGHSHKKTPEAHAITHWGLGIEHADENYGKGGSQNGSQNKNIKTVHHLAFQY